MIILCTGLNTEFWQWRRVCHANLRETNVTCMANDILVANARSLSSPDFIRIINYC